MIAAGEAWFDWSWVEANDVALGRAVREHAVWSGTALALGLAAVVLFVFLAHRWRPLDRGLRAVAIVVSAVPFVAVLAVLAPTAVNRGYLVGAVAASVAALVFRSVMYGLDGVDRGLVEEAQALGHGRLRRLTRLELPLARVHLRTGLRIGMVGAIGLIAVAGADLEGGLGGFVREGFVDGPRTQRVVGVGLLLVLAIVGDFLVRLIARRPTAY